MVTTSAEGAVTATTDMRQAVAGTSLVEPMPSLGEQGFTYQPKKDNGQIDRTSMFFYGHRGRVNVSGYLNLKDPITPAQRDLAANLIAGTLGVATSPKALAKATNCRYLDPNLVKRLLPAGDVSTIVPDANNCVLSAGGNVITVAVTKDARGWATAERMLKDGGCTVDTLTNLGKARRYRASLQHGQSTRGGAVRHRQPDVQAALRPRRRTKRRRPRHVGGAGQGRREELRTLCSRPVFHKTDGRWARRWLDYGPARTVAQ